jgi:hypothetical protein
MSEQTAKQTVPTSGKELNQEWGIGAAQAYYHEAGTWFTLPTKFPSALCDKHGYVVFHSSHELHATPGVRTTSSIRVQAGIKTLPGYKRMRD